MARGEWTARIACVAAGAMALSGVAGAAVANDGGGPSDDIDVSVEISPDQEPGILAMTVSGSAVDLTEQDSGDPAIREFTGGLPTVTVTDTRTAEEIPDGAYWYVVGSASAFSGDGEQTPIGPEYLGWIPAVADPDQTGAVAPGDVVETVLDDPSSQATGLTARELLAMAWTSQEAVGAWEASAQLVLKVPHDVAPGAYSSVLTLSLFE